MRWVTVRIFFYWLAVRLSFRFPKLVRQKGLKYRIREWDGGNFYYITYWWNGGKFEDALNLIREWVNLSQERGRNEQVLGRFLNDEEWQLGMTATAPVNLKTFAGQEVKYDLIPSGKYASLLGNGFPEHIFVYWFWLKRKLKRDHYQVLSPIFEFYGKDTFNSSLGDKKRSGEIRYRVEEAS